MLKEEIKMKANNILERTKNKQEEYKEERNIIFQLLDNLTDDNLEILEKIIEIYEKNEVIKKENESHKEFDLLKEKVERQKIRRTDGELVEKLIVFCIKDKNKKIHKFLTRENLNKYIETNKENFSDDAEVELEANEYLDLEDILKK